MSFFRESPALRTCINAHMKCCSRQLKKLDASPVAKAMGIGTPEKVARAHCLEGGLEISKTQRTISIAWSERLRRSRLSQEEAGRITRTRR